MSREKFWLRESKALYQAGQASEERSNPGEGPADQRRRSPAGQTTW